jgi:hypothetical protein
VGFSAFLGLKKERENQRIQRRANFHKIQHSMLLPQRERITLKSISEAIGQFGHDARSARSALSSTIGAALDVSGKVLKRVKREGQCKLVVQPGDVPGFIVFADCLSDAAAVEARKIRKGSTVAIRGELLSFGLSAVCLTDCRLS